MAPAGERDPGRVDAARIDEDLVRALVAEQMPQLAGLPVRAVRPGGNDHRTFRLGQELSVRIPSAPGYVPQVTKEQTWLPRLAPHLPLPIPSVRGVGVPSPRFGAPWSVYGWLEGEPLSVARVKDQVRLATGLAHFLFALRGVPACDAVMYWTHLRGEAREAFRAGLRLDEATWSRGRGRALWKALIMITNRPAAQRRRARHVLDQLFGEV